MKTLKSTSNGRTNGNGNGNGKGNGHAKPATEVLPRLKSNAPDSASISVLVGEIRPAALTLQVKAERPRFEFEPKCPWLNPTQFDRPAFVMNFPFSYATGVANNPWMEDMKDGKRNPDFVRAAVQFLAVYQNISAEGLVYVLPTPQEADLQDLMYTANLGIVLEHLADKNTVVISNFASPPRRGETEVGVKFFQAMGYDVHVAPAKFEGEAELKHLYDNVYIGGYGIRSEKATYDWMEEKFGMKIIKLREAEPYLYHLDCSIFPITKENTLVCTELFTKKELAELGKVPNLFPATVV